MHFRARGLLALLLLFASASRRAGRRAGRSGSTSWRRSGASAASRVSPDGQWVAYAVGDARRRGEPHPRPRSGSRPSSGGEPRRLTSGREARLRPEVLARRRAGSPFSPTATAARRSGRPRPLRRRARRRRPPFPPDVNGFRWSPDGKWFVFTSDVFPDCADAACLEKTVEGAREVARRRRASPSGSSSGTGTPGRTACGRTSGRRPSRDRPPPPST